MNRFATEIDIAAPPDKVWAVLTDVANWPGWNTTVTKVDGAVTLGATITVHAKISPGRAFPVKVEALDAPTHMIWASDMPMGAFRGERTFTLTATATGTHFSMVEVYSGWMGFLIERTIPDLNPAFAEAAGCLKARAEGS